MENKDHVDLAKRGHPEELPSLIKHIASKAVIGFDNIECGSGISPHSQSTGSSSPHANMVFSKESNETKIHVQACASNIPSMHSTIQALEPQQSHVSISMPTTPSGLHIEQAKMFELHDKARPTGTNMQQDLPPHSATISPSQSKKAKSCSLPNTAENLPGKTCTDEKVTSSLEVKQRIQRNEHFKDRRYDSFKTWSGKLERQLSNLRGKPQEPEIVADDLEIKESEAVPAVDRYFDALEGPELDTLRASEVLVLPEDNEWPFLLRFPISSFGMCLGVSSQAILWKTLATSPSTRFLHVSLNVNLLLWFISLALMGVVSLIYSLKIIFYFEAVKREYYHPIRVNFFFAPWIACLFLTIAVPPSVVETLHVSLWFVLMAPIFCLELKIYGQWMSGGQRRLSKVANPSNHLSIVGNFVGALLGASMGLKEGPIFFFAVGLAHYTVLFVTLYQRLPTNETLPKELHPVFFLFVAAPSIASMAWAKIQGDFDYASRMAYFIALFLYVSLAVRVNFFRGFRFSLAWWAYTFPMTGASIATIRYSNEVTSLLTRSLSVGLSAISTFTVIALLMSTIYHAFVLHDLFPNDISIAIAYQRPKSNKKRQHLRSSSSDTKDIKDSVAIDL